MIHDGQMNYPFCFYFFYIKILTLWPHWNSLMVSLVSD